MKKARQGLGWIAVLLLVVGYFASQYATATGTFADYSARVDQSPIILLTLVLFLGAIGVFIFAKDEVDNP